MTRLEGAYSTVIMTKDRVLAFRDPHGLRPLVLGRLGDRYCVASESCAFDIIGAELLRDVRPGELISITDRGLQTRQAVAERARGVLRLRVHLLRAARLAHGRHRPAGGARPDGRDPGPRGPGAGRRPRHPGARLGRPPRRAGYARASGLPQDDGLIKNRYVAAHVHPARPGAAQARAAAEVQPAARRSSRASRSSSSTTRSCAATRPARSCRCCATRAPARCTCASPRRRSATPVTTASTCRRARR